MPAFESQVIDASARVVLPESFADSTVTIMRVSEDEVHIRKTSGGPPDDVVFPEEIVTVLSDRDRDFLLDLLENPPPPNEALIKLFRDHEKRDG
jgi:hypothetical protein